MNHKTVVVQQGKSHVLMCYVSLRVFIKTSNSSRPSQGKLKLPLTKLISQHIANLCPKASGAHNPQNRPNFSFDLSSKDFLVQHKVEVLLAQHFDVYNPYIHVNKALKYIVPNTHFFNIFYFQRVYKITSTGK